MIETIKLKKIYRVGEEKVTALSDVNISIQEGEFCCIVGPSGSGKSTLLNQLAGLEKPSGGKVIINGEIISKMSENELATFRRENLGFIFQSYNLLPSMNATENVALPLAFKGVDKEKREKMAKRILKKMGLEGRETHRPTEMSGGQQQRVGIARALVTKPKVIFADEPTGNLDTVTTRQVLKQVLEIVKDNHITFVMVTHQPELAEIADRIITITDGKVQSDLIQTEEIKNEARNKLFASLQEEEPEEKHGKED